jgi:hypothetical protein
VALAAELERLPAAARASIQRFGAGTRPRSRIVSVATTRTQLFQGNPNRIYGFAMNRSVNNGAVDFDPAMTFALGMFMAALTGTLELDPEKIGELVGHEWYAINETAAGNWRVWEVIADR